MLQDLKNIANCMAMLKQEVDVSILEQAVLNGTPLQAELEEIKAEILSYKAYKDFSCMGTVYDFEIKRVFDNRISELKGE